MARKPPDILITTPESLFLILTSQAREMLRTVETLILDEVHAVAGTKRGAHLALSVERLDELLPSPVQRIGLSATQRPLEEIGRFVSGGRPIELVDAGRAKELDLEVVVPVEDMRELPSNISLSYPAPADGQEMDAGTELGARSIWPSIYPEILRLVEQHRSTIVFVNNRRLAERLALRLNELAERELARAHHGSLAREQRVEVEELLKKGEIPCLVATSSLELGIDMGAVDLVIQVESPKSVARGLQRVGRAGHELGAVSKGRIFPKFRGDLLESAVVARRMRDGAIEETFIPRNPLDVLAQQVVAICAEDEVAVDDLHDLVRRAYPFSDLSRVQLENVLDMLAGRYPSDEFAELRPRITWDRTGGTIRGLAGARRLAVTNAGTIPDRGLFTVQLADSGSKVGELDEEMVYEARAGQTFLLGASSWRIEEITRDRVLVSPAPGVPGAVPFWKGEGVGRPYELGQAIGQATRELVALRDDEALERLRTDYHLDPLAARNLLTFLREQEAVTGAVPSDRTIVVERFRDEIGDWRVCVLTPFGGRVHAPWALALSARLHESLGLDAQSIWSDDGIALHLPDADAAPAVDELLLDPAGVEELVLAAVGESALFGSRFRENAARALLIPRRRPGERTPLWQQRLKAQSLLQVARRFPAFPIVLETYRECLQDVFDLQALRQLLSGIASRELDVVDVETPSASPFASSLLFDYVATYMFEDDTPPAERRAQALSLDRDLLRELLGQEELRDLLDADAVEDVERQLRGEPRNADDLHFMLLRRGDLRVDEYDQTLAEPLLAARRAVRVHVAGEERLIAAEDAGRYRDALGVMPPSGLPDAFLETATARDSIAPARSPLGSGPRAIHDCGGERPLRQATSSTSCASWRAKSCSCAASCAPAAPSASGATRRCCGDCGEPPWRRCARRWSRPSGRRSRGSSPPGTASTGARACGRHWCRCRLSRCPSRCGSPSCSPGACPTTVPEQLDQLCATGEIVWIGAGLDRVAVYFREDAGVLGAVGGAPRPEGEVHDAIRAALSRSAEFWSDLVAAAGLEAEAGTARALGSRLGRRGDERRLAAAAGPSPLRDAEDRAATAPLRSSPGHGADRDPGPLVARGAAVRRARLAAIPGRAAARAPGDRDARRCPSRGNPGRLRRRLLGAAGARDTRAVPPRLFRRGSRRSPVCPRGRRRAAARAAAARGRRPATARPGGGGPRAALRRVAPLAEACDRSCGAGRRSYRRAARW